MCLPPLAQSRISLEPTNPKQDVFDYMDLSSLAQWSSPGVSFNSFSQPSVSSGSNCPSIPSGAYTSNTSMQFTKKWIWLNKILLHNLFYFLFSFSTTDNISPKVQINIFQRAIRVMLREWVKRSFFHSCLPISNTVSPVSKQDVTKHRLSFGWLPSSGLGSCSLHYKLRGSQNLVVQLENWQINTTKPHLLRLTLLGTSPLKLYNLFSDILKHKKYQCFVFKKVKVSTLTVKLKQLLWK